MIPAEITSKIEAKLGKNPVAFLLKLKKAEDDLSAYRDALESVGDLSHDEVVELLIELRGSCDLPQVADLSRYVRSTKHLAFPHRGWKCTVLAVCGATIGQIARIEGIARSTVSQHVNKRLDLLDHDGTLPFQRHRLTYETVVLLAERIDRRIELDPVFVRKEPISAAEALVSELDLRIWATPSPSANDQRPTMHIYDTTDGEAPLSSPIKRIGDKDGTHN